MVDLIAGADGTSCDCIALFLFDSRGPAQDCASRQRPEDLQMQPGIKYVQWVVNWYLHNTQHVASEGLKTLRGCIFYRTLPG